MASDIGRPANTDAYAGYARRERRKWTLVTDPWAPDGATTHHTPFPAYGSCCLKAGIEGEGNGVRSARLWARLLGLVKVVGPRLFAGSSPCPGDRPSRAAVAAPAVDGVRPRRDTASPWAAVPNRWGLSGVSRSSAAARSRNVT